MNWSRLKPFIAGVAPVIAVLFFYEKQLSGEDPSNFALAIKYGYSIAQVRPHAPGYPGFYVLWKIFEWATAFSPHAVLLSTNAFFAGAASLLTYSAARRFFTDRVAWIASMLVVANPMFLYFSNTSEMYAYDAAFSALVVFMLLSPVSRIRWVLFFAYGLAGAFRPSSVLLTLPVVLLILVFQAHRRKDSRVFTSSVLAILLGWILWIVPFIITLGGWSPFEEVVHTSMGMPSPTLLQNLATVFAFSFWSYGLVLVLILCNIKVIVRKIRLGDEQLLAMALLVIVPGLFFIFRYYTKGYGLLCLAPISIPAAYVITKRKHPGIIAGVVIVMNLLVFFVVPFHAPPPESTFSHRYRTNSERVQTTLLRCFSAFAPTYSHLRASDAAALEANELVGFIPNDRTHHDYILVHPTAAAWIHPRCLATNYPELTFLGCLQNSSMLESFDSGNYTENFDRSTLNSNSPLYCLSSLEFKQNIARTSPSVASGHYFRLQEVSAQDRNAFFESLDSLFLR
jgi:hypothetical protein